MRKNTSNINYYNGYQFVTSYQELPIISTPFLLTIIIIWTTNRMTPRGSTLFGAAIAGITRNIWVGTVSFMLNKPCVDLKRWWWYFKCMIIIHINQYYSKMGLLNYICNLPDDTVKTRLKSNIVAAKGAFVLFLDILIVILIV